MGKLSAVECFNTKPDRTGLDRLLGDGDGLSLRIRANGTRTWMIEYLFEGKRRRFTIGVLDRQGAAGESISSWLDNGRLSLAQARAIAGQWKADRQAGRDPIAEWEARLGARRAADEAQRKAAASEARNPPSARRSRCLRPSTWPARKARPPCATGWSVSPATSAIASCATSRARM